MASVASLLAKNTVLRSRILFSLAVIAVYRIGVHVPSPGVDNAAVMSFFSSQGGLFGLFNTFSGGALEQFSIFALGIMPYITSSIIFQLLQTSVPYLEQLKKEGDQGRRKLNQFTRYGAVILAVAQGFGISAFLMSQADGAGRPLVVVTHVGFVPFQLMTVLTLTAGTCFIMWLGEQITERGVGNGASLLIFAGIAAGIPSGAAQLWGLVAQGEYSVLGSLGIILFMVAVVAFIIFVEVAQRRIPVQYPQRGQGRQAMMTPSSHFPLKLNFPGVMPAIFASSLLMAPFTITQFFQLSMPSGLQAAFQPTGALFNILNILLIAYFFFFYVDNFFQPQETADNLKKYGGFIPGVRAGKPTADYIKRVLDRISVGGMIYLCGICVLPTLLMDQAKLPFYFGGTSLLILVGVALDVTQQINSYLINQKYEGMMKGAKLKARRVQF